MTARPDGRILFLEASDPTNGVAPAITQLNPNGTMDTTFGTNGKSSIPGLSRPTGVSLRPDGRIVVIGEVFTGTGTASPAPTDFGIVQLTANGEVDPTFGGGQVVRVGFDEPSATRWDQPRAAVVQSDGRVLVAGASASQVGNSLGYGGTGVAAPRGMVAIARLAADGVLDPTFDGDGRATFVLGEFGNATVMALEADGDIVLGGLASVARRSSQSSNPHIILQDVDYDAFVARLTPSGQLDPSFGSGGSLLFPFVTGSDYTRDGVLDLRVELTGAIRLAGTATQAVVARLTSSGQFDATFDGDGKAFVGGFAPSRAVVLPDGGAVFANETFLRVTAEGRLDPSFGADGGVTFPAPAPVIRSFAVEPDGDVLFGINNGTIGFSLYRLLGSVSSTTAPILPGSVLLSGTLDAKARLLAPLGFPFVLTESVEFFPNFHGTVRTAVADVTGDGVPDLIGGAGPGGGPHVKVIDGKTRALVGDLFAFEQTFTGGVFVSAADVTGDGKADLIVTPDRGGGPVVVIYDGAKIRPQPADGAASAQLTRYFGIDDPNFRGGARPAVADLNGDGLVDFAIAAGFGGGPRVTFWEGKSVLNGQPSQLANFFAFEAALRNGAHLSAGDVNGDGRMDVAFGAGPGGAPRVRVHDARLVIETRVRFGVRGLFSAPVSRLDEVPSLADLFAGDSSLRGGVHVALRDYDNDGKADLLAGSGDNDASRVSLFRSATVLFSLSFADQGLDPFGAALAEGVFMG